MNERKFCHERVRNLHELHSCSPIGQTLPKQA